MSKKKITFGVPTAVRFDSPPPHLICNSGPKGSTFTYLDVGEPLDRGIGDPGGDSRLGVLGDWTGRGPGIAILKRTKIRRDGTDWYYWEEVKDE